MANGMGYAAQIFNFNVLPRVFRVTNAIRTRQCWAAETEIVVSRHTERKRRKKAQDIESGKRKAVFLAWIGVPLSAVTASVRLYPGKSGYREGNGQAQRCVLSLWQASPLAVFW